MSKSGPGTRSRARSTTPTTYGADTVRAYLTAALACDEAALGRYGTPIEAIVALCQAKPDRVEAEVARDDLDVQRARAVEGLRSR